MAVQSDSKKCILQFVCKPVRLNKLGKRRYAKRRRHWEKKKHAVVATHYSVQIAINLAYSHFTAIHCTSELYTVDGNPDFKTSSINTLKTQRRLLYLKTQFVPRSKHFSSRL